MHLSAALRQADFAGFEINLADGVLVITFNRPDGGNALPSAAIPQLGQIFEAAAKSDQVRVLLICGQGPNFCVGGDVKGFATTLDHTPDQRHDDYWTRMDRARQQMEAFIALPCPVIVACQGAAAGAAVAYLLGADIALGEPGTRIVFPHQRLALPPDGGLSYLLPRVVGLRKASELTLTAASLDAAEAFRLGIISRIVPEPILQDEARALARRIASFPPASVRRARDLLRGSENRSPHEQLCAERDAVAEAVATEDFANGVRAFMTKPRAATAS